MEEALKLAEQGLIKLMTGEREITHYKGRRFIPGFLGECMEYAMNEWEMPNNSVVISSYMKTGTTWCMEIVRQLLSKGDDELIKTSKLVPNPMHFLELGPKTKYELFPFFPFKLFYTHMAADIFNFDKIKQSKSKLIYVYRNPKDQAVSWYHFSHKISNFTEKQKQHVLGKDWNTFFDKYISGEHPTGLRKGEWYPDYMKEWMEHANADDGILVVEYEALKKDFPRELRRMAKFLEIELQEGDVERITERCSIATMKKEAAATGSGFLNVNVRKGEVGGWKNQFTVAQSELMDRLLEEKLAGTGIKFTYEL